MFLAQISFSKHQRSLFRNIKLLISKRYKTILWTIHYFSWHKQLIKWAELKVCNKWLNFFFPTADIWISDVWCLSHLPTWDDISRTHIIFSEVEGSVVDQQRKGTDHLFACSCCCLFIFNCPAIAGLSWLAKKY